MEEFAGSRIPDLHFPKLRGGTSAGDQKVAVFAEGEGEETLGLTGEALEESAAVGFVQQHFAIAGDGDGGSVR